jgi:hypothetical protein
MATKPMTVLEVGDSIYYNSIVPHYVSCKGGKPASIYAVLYIPEIGGNHVTAAIYSR